MAQPVLSFESDIIYVDGKPFLYLKDTSDYGDEVEIENRFFFLTNSKGVVVMLPIPEDNVVTYQILKDTTFIIELVANYIPETETKTIVLRKNAVVAPFIIAGRNELDKKYLIEFNSTGCCSPDSNVEVKIDTLNRFISAAINLASADILNSQKALDYGNLYLKKGNC